MIILTEEVDLDIFIGFRKGIWHGSTNFLLASLSLYQSTYHEIAGAAFP